MIVDQYLQYVQEIISKLATNPIFIEFGLTGLFVNSVLASTALPLPIEIAVSALLAAGQDKFLVFLTLAAGTVAGGFLSYFIGKSGDKVFRFLKPKSQEENKQNKKSHEILTKYGWLALVAAPWIPVFGDIIIMIAGAKSYDFRKFTIAMTAGKIVKAVATVYFIGLITTRLFG
ncbi:putative membrane protein [Candidatus Nitrososphaera evergladensis SR1]|uniref:Putative membrane protein n=1 Tax=Candidatus Nitrososphaera evergladensis SR1 TaxID=1459636 RepID=A0A075MYG4_9ARCH|nr:VTT domain-containing protein [Candidatus Nitrososphaera evergladensis]AIF84309.1 putative membrane protein [Candidatus Nitrososphaera evergladensis SR1]